MVRLEYRCRLCGEEFLLPERVEHHIVVSRSAEFDRLEFHRCINVPETGARGVSDLVGYVDASKRRVNPITAWDIPRPSPDIGDYVEQIMATARKRVAASMQTALDSVIRNLNAGGDKSDFVCGSLAAYNLMKDWLMDEELECMMRERGLND